MVQIRPAGPEEYDAVAATAWRAFGEDPRPDEAELERALVDPGRWHAAYDGRAVVGTAAAYTLALTVPGGAGVPTAGVTGVGVTSTHRRRGVLRALMAAQLDDVARRGEPLAALWASEAGIYRRFGYGTATRSLSVAVDRPAVRLLAESPATVALTAPGDARTELAQTYATACARRPGWWARDERWWTWVLHDPEHRRDGASPLRCALAHDEGRPVGYVLYATRPRSDDDDLPAGRALVRELVAISPAGVTALWRHLLGLDLTATVAAEHLAVDDPVLHLLDDPRRLRARFRDGLWVRPLDVPAALAARRYAAPLDVVLDVADPFRPATAGVFRLTGGRDGAACRRSDAAPDLALDVAALGAAYLGGVTLCALAAAGQVRELRPGALAAASVAFGAERAPHCPAVF